MTAKPKKRTPGRKPVARKQRAANRRKPAPAWQRPALFGLAGVAIVAATVGTGAWIWQSSLIDRGLAAATEARRQALAGVGLTVQEITVRGRAKTHRADLLTAIGVARGDQILEFDPHAARQRIEAIGWVKSARVSRMLPNHVHVELVEREPYARWQMAGRQVLIDAEGEVITAEEIWRYLDLPKLVGEGANLAAAELVPELEIWPDLYRRVEAATLIRGRRWTVELTGGVTVKLPERGLREAWARMAALETKHGILDRDLVAVDLRYPDRLVVQLKPASAGRFRQLGQET